ncbi:hypothetical protein THAOC_28110 [Thalassiosira oceanica]|uniref:Protein kinase domain-containing protein n=1 Tax=Thalassiosira oceanica TaxID=159749 RepID=K0RFV0_THAOC|nr:hypothetical protein THAOC_28110 [Thalassiosira oceanica]|eukprot:EJK52598.1 hypothetical protein THAOC_28110 [Thalassiosira oceanica]
MRIFLAPAPTQSCALATHNRNDSESSFVEDYPGQKELARKLDPTQNSVNAVISSETRQTTKVALAYLKLILSYVNLKESMGMERALLVGLMANGVDEGDLSEMSRESGNDRQLKRSSASATSIKGRFWDKSPGSIEGEKKSFRLNLIVNDIVLIVELQHRIILELRQQTGLQIHDNLSTDNVLESVNSKSNSSKALLRLVGESIRPSEEMQAMQENLRLNFDVLQFQNLYILEELDNCSFETFDLLSFDEDGNGAESIEKELAIPGNLAEKPSLDEWEVSLYEVEFHKRIGRGSAGTTYLAKWARQDVAVKVAATNDLGLEGWKAEIASLKKCGLPRLNHSTGAIYNPSPLTYGLILEYCNGGDLMLAMNEMTPPNFYMTIAVGVASGLFYLHKMEYLHRDIKPSNVLLSGDLSSGSFVAKLTDFGLAAKLNPASSEEELTAETGTYRYMSPEVIRHENYSYAADVFSYAMLIWELLTREKPFKSLSQIEAASLVGLEKKRPPFPEGTPSDLKGFIECCWSDKPADRPAVSHILSRLEEIELGFSMKEREWIQSPTGHPVYEICEQEVERPPQNKKTQSQKKKMTSIFRMRKF